MKCWSRWLASTVSATILLGTTAAPAAAQLQPQGAHVNLYFPQLADGGTAAAKWQTTFTFVNLNDVSTNVELYTYDNSGAPLGIDLGFGTSNRQAFAIPAYGTRVLKSLITGSNTIVGWAVAWSDVPVQAVAAYRLFLNGTATQEISALPTLPTTRYSSPATKFLGVAIANVFRDGSVSLDLKVRDSNGNALGSTALTLGPHAHTAFVLAEKFPSLGDSPATLIITGKDLTYDQFIAWTLGGDSTGIWSSLPPGAFSWPVSHWDRVWMVYLDLVKVVKQGKAFTLKTIPKLTIAWEKEINAHALNGNEIQIHSALSELISDSPSELAYAIGHELAHTYQQQNNGRTTWYTNAELDADVWAVLLALGAGYDPYGIGGTLGKLSMASGQAGLISQFGLELFDVHRSFNTRLDTVFSALVGACNSSASVKTICDNYRKWFHPSFPDTSPLAPDQKAP